MTVRYQKLLAGIALLAIAASAPAIDVVVKRDGTREGGKISASSKTEVTVTKQVGGNSTIPVNEIDFIEWDGAPATMALGRASLAAGQLDTAEKQLGQALTESAGSDNTGLRGDLDFLLAKTLALRALADSSKAADAAAKLKAYLSSNRDHYRLYDAQLLMGDVSLAAGDYPAAIAAYTSLGTAPWKDFQMAAQIGQGRVLLAQGDVAGAKREFDAVASVSVDSPAQKSRRLEGLLGQARCLQAQQQYQPAVEILDQVIDQASAVDTRIQAEAYVRQGEAYSSLGGSPKDAIMAYLHVDVIPTLSKEADLHAESLFHLSRLWKLAGQEERARDAAETLRGQYPDSAWTKKLGG